MRKLVVLALLGIIFQAQLAAVCGDVCKVADTAEPLSQPNCHGSAEPTQHGESHDCENTCDGVAFGDTLLLLHERPWVAPTQTQTSFVDARGPESHPSQVIPAAVAAPPDIYLGDVRLLQASLQV